MEIHQIIDGIDIATSATVYSSLIVLPNGTFYFRDVAAATKARIGVAISAVLDSTPTGTVTLTLEGSVDGKNFEAGTALLTTIASDGAHDIASILVDFYPIYRLKCTEDGTSNTTGLHVWLAFTV